MERAPSDIELHLPTSDLALAATVWGPPDGLPFLGLHGWLDNVATFARLAPLLPRLRLVCLDLPGHGQSQWRATGSNYHFIDWIPDVFEAADALGWQRFGIVGHSMGAAIATLMAGACPERITHLICIEGFGPLVYRDEDAPQGLAESLSQRRRLANKSARPHASVAAAGQKLQQVVGYAHPDSARLLVERGTHAVPGGVTWRADPRLRRISPQRFTEGQVQAFLRRITCPSLLVLGGSGLHFSPEMIEQRKACLPQLQSVALEGGHHLHLDDPEPVASAIHAFLEG